MRLRLIALLVLLGEKGIQPSLRGPYQWPGDDAFVFDHVSGTLNDLTAFGEGRRALKVSDTTSLTINRFVGWQIQVANASTTSVAINYCTRFRGAHRADHLEEPAAGLDALALRHRVGHSAGVPPDDHQRRPADTGWARELLRDRHRPGHDPDLLHDPHDLGRWEDLAGLG